VRHWSFVAVALTIAIMLGGAGALLAYDSSQAHTIADGITVGGVDVGGLTVVQARSRLRAAYTARLHTALILRDGRRRFRLTPTAAHLRVEAAAAVNQAVARTRADNLFTRVLRSLSGGAIHANFEPAVIVSRPAVDELVDRIRHALDRPMRNATVTISGKSVGPVASRRGLAVDAGRLRMQIKQALAAGTVRRPITIPTRAIPPKVTTSMLAARYPAVITVDRAAFRLRLWKHLRLVKQYRIAVGMAGLQTPAGLYHIQDKQTDPSWHVPNSAWAGSLAGQTIPPGPADPLKARWMGFFDGAGIHGTDELSSLGTAASHGCIRMAIPDVIELYNQTPLGTPVYIG
jgi:lipoprotein-anchoring transpeptidase ErfK/SrfK